MQLNRFTAIEILLLGFAVVNTSLVGANLLLPTQVSQMTTVTAGHPSSGVFAYTEAAGIAAFNILDKQATVLAPSSWMMLGALVVWRGQIRATWLKKGFGEDTFELFANSRGGETRAKLLKAMSSPKDRFQAAKELGLQWRGVRRHVEILTKKGLLEERIAYGRVRIYSTSYSGNLLLHLVADLPSSGSVVAAKRTGSRSDQLDSVPSRAA